MKNVARLFAVVHSVSGLILLLFSGWFIGACATAGVDYASIDFNYLLPAVIIRALALLRIFTGYAQMWTGHRALLSHVKRIRLSLFSKLKNKVLVRRAEGTEALSKHSESIASLNMAWTVHNLGALCMFVIASATLVVWLIDVAWLWAVFMICFVAIFTIGFICIATKEKTILIQKNQFRHDTEHHIESAALWHLQEVVKHSDMENIYKFNQRHHGVGEQMLWWVQTLAYCLLLGLMYVVQATGIYRGEAALLVFILLLLSTKDWLGPMLRSQSAFSDYQESNNAFKTLPVTNITSACQQPDNQINTLVIKELASERLVNSVSFHLNNGQLLLIKGGSGSGKTTILQAIAGLLPYSGEKIINGQSVSSGFVDGWYYADQAPQVLSASLSSNLRLAKPCASDKELMCALQFADLGHFDNLSEWLGGQGRQLSGGELKRLNIARAYLFDASLYLFDEPFEGLDDERQATIARAINKLSHRAPVIVASHIVPSCLAVNQTLEI